jgi:type IV pilus assembly protein PilE
MVKHQTAFTLIEMMAVLLIIGILSAFAYPSYRQVKLKTARAEGRAALMRLMQQQERHYTQHRRYRRFSANDNAPFPQFSGATAQASAYRLDAIACPEKADDPDCILLRATPASGFDDPHCGILTLDSSGEQSAAGSTEAGNPGGCW